MTVRIRKLHDGRWDHAPKCTIPLELSESVSGGDLVTLVTVAAAAVVNGVIGHCRPSKIKLDW